MFGALKDKIARYIEVNVKLFKINFIQHTANILSYFIFTIVSLFFLLAIMLFVGFGLMETFSVMLDSRIGGVFVVVGIYTLLLVILVLLRKPVMKMFAGAAVSILTRQDIDEGELPIDEEGTKPQEPK